jgi:hypothetical protein
MNNGDILKIINYITNKAQSGNVISPLEYPTIINSAQLSYLKRKTGVPEEYKPELQVSQQEPDASQKLSNDLIPFKITMSVDYDGVNTSLSPPLAIDSKGYAQLPSNFYYRTALSYRQFFNKKDAPTKVITSKIEVVNDDIWNSKLVSSIDAATEKSPIANFLNTSIRFYPIKNVNVDFSYIRYPINCVFDYYIDTYGAGIYLPQGATYTLKTGEEYPANPTATAGTIITSQSIEVEFGDLQKIDIISYALFYIGCNLGSETIKQYAEQFKIKGL